MSGVLKPVDQTAWGALAPGFLDYNYRQMWDFGVACADRVGAVSEHVAVELEGEIIGLADVRVKRIPALGTGIAYINGGPLVRRNDDSNADRLALCLKSLIQEYAERRGMVLRVMSPVGEAKWDQTQAAVLSNVGFSPCEAVRPYRTFLLDIARPPEEIRRNMAQKWRNGLNQSEKRGLSIRTGTDPALLREFCDLFSRFIDRKGFTVDLTPPFYLAVQEKAPEADRFEINLAEVDGTVVAGHVASLLGDTSVYLLGASSDEGLKAKASYLLQWRAIQSARERGLRWYDLGGIDPEGNPGVYHFKSGLGGQDITAPGPVEYAASGFERAAVRGCERAYRLLRRVRRIVARP
ncbi:MAG: peptidoglycan bridge formation glycyltransferase FemA/FemB family protein [Phycisphaerae bacterium]|nr:peptidoglycan bridge formation glycyltransferase FemA/FemB family protein [Phycisphaerae bacterium]